MGSLSTGGGSSAVAASAHAGCTRFRLTDPLITRVSRKHLATHIGAPDDSAGIPEARWMRAMTFENLVHAERFVSELLTKAVGQLGLDRPVGVRRRSGGVTLDRTADQLAVAHDRAVGAGEATMLTELAIPYRDMEAHEGATPVKPDFAIVCPRVEGGSWLIMGDAKDYERVRSRIDDQRLLKGFLQVALGAVSAEVWSRLPDGMVVHRYGALAVPRNSFLQPEAQVEDLEDHRREVLTRARERKQAMQELGPGRPTEAQLPDYVADIAAEFDPQSCASCNLFAYCRDELRASSAPESLLIELGVDRLEHPAVIGLVDGQSEVGSARVATVAQVRATVDGFPQWAARLRTDPAGLPGSINVVLAKSDAAALGMHGIAIQRWPGDWVKRTFLDPQAPQTRRAAMRVLGSAIQEVLDSGQGPIHLVVPDRPTADLLASAADSLAGVELSRLRWERDVQVGRDPLTFDGELATIPEALDPLERLAVSFLLEEDRARAMTLRSPIVDLRRVLNSHIVAGGPSADSGRLDYLVRWAEAHGTKLDHRVVSDEIADSWHTPGARMSNNESDEIHAAFRQRHTHPEIYRDLVTSTLDYKIDFVERALAVLSTVKPSKLQAVHRALELDAQEVWGRRLALQASDLVRFSRTYRPWRNAQVEMLDADVNCNQQLSALADFEVGADLAQQAGVRQVASARVVALAPTRLEVASRRFVDGTDAIALHINGRALVESPATTLKIQKGSFKFGQFPIGTLRDDGTGSLLLWLPDVCDQLEVGDELILADASWFDKVMQNRHEFTVRRPSADNQAAPKKDCTLSSYAQSPDEHKWCCRPHAIVEAEYADELAARRYRGELNPQTWPPLVDEDRFDVLPADVELSEAQDGVPPAELTLDDLD